MEIVIVAAVIVLLIVILRKRKKKLYNVYWDNKSQTWIKYQKQQDPRQRKHRRSDQGYYRETGYIYNEETQLWEPTRKRKTPRI